MRTVLMTVLVAAVIPAGCDRVEPGAATTSSASTSAPPPAGTAPKAEPFELVLPAGTELPIVLDSSIGSDTSKAEDQVRAHLAHGVALRGVTVLPPGSHVSGVVIDATRSGRVKGTAHLAVRFDTIEPAGSDTRYLMRTTSVSRTAETTRRKDAIEIGAPAAGGAVIGALVGGGKGALIGTAVGAGAGTAVVLSTRGKDVRLARGTALTLHLAQPLAVKVRS